MNNIIVYDAFAEQWVRFESPSSIIVANDVADVVPALKEIERLVNERGFTAVGFISYEAAPAFDSALYVSPADHSFPLLWFGLFGQPTEHAVPSLQVPAGSPPFHSPLSWNPSLTKEEYVDCIDRIKSYISAGDTYQVNYSFRLRAPFDGDAYELFLQLTQAQPSSHGGFIETDEFAICSASPELFFSLDREHIVTRPMKGTGPRGLTPSQDKIQAVSLRMSEKNRAENLMIVDMMRNDLGRIAEFGSVRVSSLFDVERYPTLWQMTSTVSATTKAPVVEIMKALFPCASITGAPKSRTMEIIGELETTPRKIYTGAIGFIAPNRKAQFNVAIRTVMIDKKKNEAEYGVGGGIVWASTTEGEYDECLTKARVLTERRPQFELFETMLFTQHEGFFLLEDHLARLKDSCEYFDFEFAEVSIREALNIAREGFCGQAYRVRLQLHPKGVPVLDAQPFDAATLHTPVRIDLAKTPVDSKSLFLYHKTTQRAMYDDALALTPACDDVILWNERNEITESTIANVVVEIDGELFTPPVECGLLAGTFRGRLLKEGRIKERVITLEEFTQSPRIFLINSLRKWREAVLET